MIFHVFSFIFFLALIPHPYRSIILFLFGVCSPFCMDQKIVIQTKSVEYMPLSLSLASLVNAICWTAYALIKFDLYITVSYY